MRGAIFFFFSSLLTFAFFQGPLNAETKETAKAGRVAVSTKEALTVLASVCGASLPDFSTANSKAMKIGMNPVEEEFTFNKNTKSMVFAAGSPTGRLGVHVSIKKGGIKTCVVTYYSRETVKKYLANLSTEIDLEALKKTGQWPKYRNSNADFHATNTEQRRGGLLELELVLTVQ